MKKRVNSTENAEVSAPAEVVEEAEKEAEAPEPVAEATEAEATAPETESKADQEEEPLKNRKLPESGYTYLGTQSGSHYLINLKNL